RERLSMQSGPIRYSHDGSAATSFLNTCWHATNVPLDSGKKRSRIPVTDIPVGGDMPTSRTRVLGLLAVVFLLGLHTTAYAQTGAASITGLLTDQSGAAAPGVTVTAINQATNVAYTAVSNSAGNYDITSVPVGTYLIKAELQGFKTATTKPFQLEA